MTPLHSTLKRALTIDGREYVLTLSPTALKLTLKGKRNGVDLPWAQLVNGEAALAVALHASLGAFASKHRVQTAAQSPPTAAASLSTAAPSLPTAAPSLPTAAPSLPTAAPPPPMAATRTVATPKVSRRAVKPKRKVRSARKK